jgi:hypothetical protein
MKKIIPALITLILCCNISFAKPVLTSSKYLISTLYDGATGTVSPGNSTYQLAYFSDRSTETATASDYWIIKNLGGMEYTFQNSSTLKYIRYDGTAIDRAALVMSDTLMADKSTSFTLELKMANNLCYYMIRSVVNTTKLWDRRVQIQGTIYPVGVYPGAGGDIESFVFYDSEGNSIIDDGKVPVELPKATQTLGSFSSYFSVLTFDGKIPAVDTSKKEFYITVDEVKMNSYLNMKVNYTFNNPAYSLYINNNPVTSGIDFKYLASSQKVPIEIRNGASVISTGSFIVSCLPFIQLYSDVELGGVYNLGRISVTEPSKSLPSEILLSSIKLRGDYASRVEKKSYALKLKDTDGETSLDRSFYGLRSDNNWILDAMYIDPGRMRNRISTDLWNEFSTRPYYAASEPDMVNGTRGKFVEVFINDSYNGLYCMTEKIDRKQLNLKKLKYSADSSTVTQRGALYKADNWSIGTQLGNPITWGVNILPAYDNKSEYWTAFNVKYPDLGDGEPVEWKPAFDAVSVPYWETSDEVFTSKVSTYFDLPVFIDYYLFLDLLLATDNHGKNYYLSVYDQTVSPKVSLTPWDLDGVWGRRWDGSSYLTWANQSFESFINANEPHQNNLYLRMMASNTEGFNDKLKIRYKELRGTYFSYTSLMARFQKYCGLFNKSGVCLRERSRWSIQDINLEMTFLSDWITARLNYLDIQYLKSKYTDLAGIVQPTIKLSPNPVINLLTVDNVKSGDIVQIISIQGTELFRTISNGNSTLIDMSGYTPGIYLIKAGDSISKVIKK